MAALREIVRQFTPNWFTVTMGTGILAAALNQFPAGGAVLHRAGEGLWWLTIVLFVGFCLLYGARWLLFTREACRIFGHSVASMFFGAIPMGLATIINGIVIFGLPRWGSPALSAALWLWWLDVVLAVLCGVVIPFLMFTQQKHSMESMTAVWLIPVVAAEVAAASAGLIVPHLQSPGLAMLLLVTGYALWAFSVPLALSILVILVLRLALHKLPHRDMAASGWLALGPLGTGALGLLLLGAAAQPVFAAVGRPEVGATAAGLGLIGGTVLWGYGAWWLLLAILTTGRYLREGMPFNIGWWAFTFPLGVYSVATLALARQTGLPVLLGVGAVLVVALAAFWSVVAVRTLQGAWRRTLFVAPCLVSGAIPADFAAEGFRPAG
jgi:C4-dicarboxylate transporter/malic acid transport protein